MSEYSTINRISEIRKAPFSYKEKDILTAAEKYLLETIDCDLIKLTDPCFPNIDGHIQSKITQVWMCSTTAYHLYLIFNNRQQDDIILLQAARIYEQEAQRIMGSIFPLNHPFWKSFYSRQGSAITKPLIAIDALHFMAKHSNQISYQLLLQSFKSILEGHHGMEVFKKEHFEKAKRLLTDLPLTSLQSWINLQLTK